MTNTALPANVRTQIDEIGSADIVVGIPSYRNATTIAYVTEAIGHGLKILSRNERRDHQFRWWFSRRDLCCLSRRPNLCRYPKACLHV